MSRDSIFTHFSPQTLAMENCLANTPSQPAPEFLPTPFSREKVSRDESRLEGERKVVFTRCLGATRDLVFQFWTDPVHVEQWWGPQGFTCTIDEMDVRPGGAWRFVMHGPHGLESPNTIIYRHVAPLERLSYIHLPDQDANYEFEPFDVNVSFEEQGETTRVCMRMFFDSPAARQRMLDLGLVESVQSSLDCLEEHLAYARLEAEFLAVDFMYPALEMAGWKLMA